MSQVQGVRQGLRPDLGCVRTLSNRDCCPASEKLLGHDVSHLRKIQRLLCQMRRGNTALIEWSIQSQSFAN